MKLDRTKLSVIDLHAKTPDREYWLSRTPAERLAAVEIYRQAAYGRANTSRRLQRVLEIVKRG